MRNDFHVLECTAVSTLNPPTPPPTLAASPLLWHGHRSLRLAPATTDTLDHSTVTPRRRRRRRRRPNRDCDRPRDQPFSEAPALTVSFSVEGRRHSLGLTLPLSVCSFIEPLQVRVACRVVCPAVVLLLSAGTRFVGFCPVAGRFSRSSSMWLTV